MAANAGTGEENCSWDLNTCPITLHSISTSTFKFMLLHEATWTPMVDLHVRTHVGKQQAEWFRNFSEAKSSDFSLRKGNGSEILGAVLQDKTIPENAIRDLLQARSFCFPTAAIVSCNHCGTWDTQCKLCHAVVDTYAHRMMQCPHLHGAQHTMHYDIARVLIHHLCDTVEGQGSLPQSME
eukprot:2863294-Rhodomonas_salina.1